MIASHTWLVTFIEWWQINIPGIGETSEKVRIISKVLGRVSDPFLKDFQ